MRGTGDTAWSAVGDVAAVCRLHAFVERVKRRCTARKQEAESNDFLGSQVRKFHGQELKFDLEAYMTAGDHVF